MKCRLLCSVQLRHVKRLGKQFTYGRQEDSHELYLRMLEAVEAVQVGRAVLHLWRPLMLCEG
jgi:hypothetical protein